MSVEAAELRVGVVADYEQAEKDIAGFGDRLNSAGDKMTSIGKGLTLGLTAPIVGAGLASVKTAADFETSMNILQQVSGATGDQMAQMSKMALKLGADTVFSSGDAADAMLELAKAGMSTNDVMKSIGGVMDLAAAGGVGLADAANLTAAALNAFHLDASKSAEVANMLAAGANASAADISDLGFGLGQAGFAFASTNQPVENLVASLALLSNVGLKGGDAGTALKNAFMRLMNPTDKAKDVMKQLNLQFYDSQGNMKKLPDLIQTMNDAFRGMTNEQRDSALSTLFLSDGMKAMIPLLDVGKEGFNKMVAEVQKQGAAADTANARMKGLAGAVESFKGSIESLLIRVATPFLGMLTEWTNKAVALVNAIGDLPDWMINLGVGIAAAAAAIGPLLIGFGTFLKMAGPAISFFAEMNPWILAITAAIVGLAVAWNTNFLGIQDITTSVMQSVTGWFSDVVAGAESLASGIATAFAKTKFPSLEELWNDFKAGDFEALASKFKSTVFTLLVNLDSELKITATATDLKTKLTDAVNSVIGALNAFDFKSFSDKAADVAKKVGDFATSLRDSAYTALTDAITKAPWTGASDFIKKAVDSLTTAVKDIKLEGIDWKKTLETILLLPIKLAVAGILWLFPPEQFNNLKTAIHDAFLKIDWAGIGWAFVGLGQQIFLNLQALAKDIASDFGVSFDNMTIDWTKFTDKLKPAWDTLVITWTDFWAKYQPDWKQLIIDWTGFFTQFMPDWSKLPVDIPKLWSDISNAFQPVVSLFNTWKQLMADIVNLDPLGWMNHLADAIRSIPSDQIGNAIGTWLGNAIVGAIKGMIGQVGQDVGNTVVSAGIGVTLAQNLASSIRSTNWTDVISAVDAAIWNIITALAGTAGQGFISMMQGLGASLKQGLSELFGPSIDLFMQKIQPLIDIFNNLSGILGMFSGGAGGGGFSLASLFSGGGGLGDIFPKPTWITDLTDWSGKTPSWWQAMSDWATTLPTWIGGLGLWSTTVPDWFANFTSWAATVPSWFATSFTAWSANVPSWFSISFGNWSSNVPVWFAKFTNWSATNPDWWSNLNTWHSSTPGWVTTLVNSTPGWVSSLLGWHPTVTVEGGGGGGGGSGGAKASGTNYWKGGTALVGEHGAELVRLPQGSRIYNNDDTMAMLAGAGGLVLHIDNVHIYNDQDIQTFATKLANEFNKRLR